MKKIFLFSFLFLISCSEKVELEKKDGFLYLSQKDTTLKIELKDIDYKNDFLKDAFRVFVPYAKEKEYFVSLSNDFSDKKLFFAIGDALLANYKNETLSYMLIEKNFVDYAIKKNLDVSFPYIKEFKTFYQENDISLKEQLYYMDWIIYFLIDQIYYISLEEFFERPFRYFSIDVIGKPFYEVAISPEIYAFACFLEDRFGKKLYLKLMEEPYDEKSFEEIFGESLSDLEVAFAKQIQNKKFENKYMTSDQYQLWIQLLRKNNINTVDTLFEKG